MPLDDRTLRIVEQADRALDGIERQTMTAMEDALQTSYNRLEAELLTKYRQNATNLDLLPNQRKLLILGQLKNNLDLIGGASAESLKGNLTATLKQSSEEGAALAKALAKSIGNEDLGDFDGIPLEALRFQAEQGVDRLIQHGKAFAGRASSIVEIGLTTGAGPKKVAAELRKQLGVTKGRAVAIARTETLSSHNQAAQAAYQRAGLEYFQLISTQDARTCPFCAARNMQVYKLGESVPPVHVSCFPAGTIVDGPKALVSTARHYEGEVVIIKTASGKELTGTPNHPVMTPHGWIPMGRLNKSSYVFSGPSSQRVALRDPDDYLVPSLIEKVATTLGELSGTIGAGVPVSPEDFHGDGVGSKVCVVRPDSLLRDSIDPELLQLISEQAFHGRSVRLFSLPRIGDLDTRFGGLLPASGSIVSSASPGLAGGGGRALCLHSIGLGTSTDRDFIRQEDAPDGSATNSEMDSDLFFGNSADVEFDRGRADLLPHLRPLGSQPISVLLGDDFVPICGIAKDAPLFKDSGERPSIDAESFSSRFGAFASNVSLDRIVEVRVEDFSGHVYNLQTVSGFYFANDILTHNCRCYSLPWKSEWQELGLSGDEWAADFRAGAISELESIGRKPDNGPSPFEKAAGLPAPKAIWSPGSAPVRPSPPAPPPPPPPPAPEPIAIHEEYIARGASAFESEFAELDAPAPPANIAQLNSALSAAQAEFVKAVDRVGGDIEAAWLEPEGARVKAAYRDIELTKADPGLQAITSIRRQLLSSGSAVDVSEVVITEGATIELRERQIRFEMREFYALAQGRGLSQLKGIEYIRERAEANPLTGMINIGLNGDLSEAQTALWHEMAHMIEFEDPSIADAAKSWIRARATGSEQSINSIQGVDYYDESEVALPDKFISPYVGKIYDQDATEVISMGLQYFTGPEEMLKFYRKDPEHFRFVVGAVLKPG
jgi:SPP1 gp7 family putative phage head morphogenesis protein